mgnify:CR=1 FL=1
MNERPTYGLSRRELEQEMRWQLRKAPRNASDLPVFIGEVIVNIIDKNNAALAEVLAAQHPDEADGIV